jgi:hypothetical protein
MTAGYSGTPLAKKLGFKPGFVVRFIGEPKHYLSLFNDLPGDLARKKDARDPKDLIHYFTTDAEELSKQLPLFKRELKPAGMIWVSWPKRSAKVPTDVTEDVIRAIALRIGLVDVKVCAVDDVWSGLKLVIPVKDRKG